MGTHICSSQKSEKSELESGLRVGSKSRPRGNVVALLPFSVGIGRKRTDRREPARRRGTIFLSLRTPRRSLECADKTLNCSHVKTQRRENRFIAETN